MAMLAEPRRRQRFSTDPRGLNWSKDDSKFGQKLMEKYGWSKGRGLGANEDGITDHIKISNKSDNRGVGCSRKHEDNWVAHQDDFNSLLASLNESNASGTATPTESHDMKEVLSLEKKSSTSKRVHYHKFTRGKDLSRADNHAMDCIFGRRKSKSSHGTPQAVDSKPPSDDETDPKPEEAGSQETQHGVTTIATKESVQEYFARKMAEIQKSRSAATAEKPSVQECSSGQSSDEVVPVDGSKEKKKKKSKKRKMEENCETNEKNELVEEVEEQKEESSGTKKKKKKSKKKKTENEDQMNDEEAEVKLEVEHPKSEEVGGTKKKKKSKRSRDEEDGCDSHLTTEVDSLDPIGGATEEPKRKKQKKSKKRKQDDVADEACDEISTKIPKSDVDIDSGIVDTNCESINNELANGVPSNKYKSLDSNVVKYDYTLNQKSKKALENGFKGSNLGSIEGYGGGVKLKLSDKVKKTKKGKKSKR